jgi:hypothetical protein
VRSSEFILQDGNGCINRDDFKTFMVEQGIDEQLCLDYFTAFTSCRTRGMASALAH